jgi:phosphate transport system substrate-binding protein
LTKLTNFVRPTARVAGVAVAAAIAVAGFAFSSTIASAAEVHLLETGSSLLYPEFNLWVPAYAEHHPDVKITTQSTGSGTGIAQAISGIAQIGASDAYMSDAQMKPHPGLLNIPLVISAQMVNYNVPGLNNRHLKLSGPVLAGIYDGHIKYWNDKAIEELNPGVKLPHHEIVPVHRTDGSGDTFIFTQYLSFSTPSWNSSVGYGTTVSWPAVQGGIGAEGNPGMVNASKGTPYSIAYIGISFKDATDQAKLGEALLKNRAGKFVLPTPKTVKAAVEATSAKTPKDERISLIFAPGDESYPIINYEYAIINSRQSSPEVAAALREFLNWCIEPSGGNAPHFTKPVGFAPLPPAIAELSKQQVAMIK